MRCDMHGSSLDCYVDANFASMFGHEDALSKTSAQSRTGFIIYLCGCPIIWSSKQQKLVALSSLESEYIALSTAVRDVLHLRNIVQEISTKMNLPRHLRITARSQIFEDNKGAIAVATAPNMTPRTKHYCTRLHFFKQHVHTPLNPSGCLELVWTPSKDNRADLFSKVINRYCVFTHLRYLVCGWDNQRKLTV